MVDYFTLALTHGVIILMLWRLAARHDLDDDGAPEKEPHRPWLKQKQAGEGENA